MFTPPVTSGGIGVWRPTANTGTITVAANAYDLPLGVADDSPYLTAADRGLLSGYDATPGTVNYDVVEFNTFKQGLSTSLPKTNFSQCQLTIGLTALVESTVLVSGLSVTNTFVASDFTVDYQVDGTNWVNIVTVNSTDSLYNSLGGAGNEKTAVSKSNLAPGTTVSNQDYAPTSVVRSTYSVNIPASSFSTNLNNLKVRFRAGTCTNSTNTAYKSYANYVVWDIRANIS